MMEMITRVQIGAASIVSATLFSAEGLQKRSEHHALHYSNHINQGADTLFSPSPLNSCLTKSGRVQYRNLPMHEVKNIISRKRAIWHDSCRESHEVTLFYCNCRIACPAPWIVTRIFYSSWKWTNFLTTNTPRPGALRTVLMLAALLLTNLTLIPAHADNLTKLHSFSKNNLSGNQPTSKLIQASDGYFYGTTLYGGTNGYGTIFRMSTTGTVTTLYSFDYLTTGYYPYGGLYQDSTGAFYGATYHGGVNSYGVIYKMTVTSGSNPIATVTPYWSFKGYNSTTPALSEPGGPYYGELIKGSDGKLYGTTPGGGVNDYGAAYSLSIVSTGTPTLSILHSFNIGVDAGGYYPHSGVTEGGDGKLYGTTYNGGANGVGTVYSLSKDGVTFTDVHDFSGYADGGYPEWQLTKSSSGDFYSVTFGGGASNDGTLYKISSTGVYSTLYTFDGNVGQYPVWQPIIAADGKLYGATLAGGSNSLGYAGAGIVYKYDLTANTISVFSNFDGINGFSPNAITQGTDKHFYGTSQYGGVTSAEAGFSYGNGSAFKIGSTGAISLLYSFYIHTGYYPYGRIVQGPDGQFYGTTYYGGYYDHGTIYKINANGNVTILHHFNNAQPLYEGNYPQAELIVGKDGSLYGASFNGGLYGYGTIFKISTSGAFTILYNLKNSQGTNIVAPLLQGTDGNFYGVCSNGGANGRGTIFKLAGTKMTILHQFTNANGQATYPQFGLAQDMTGNLYGATYYGGANNAGALYEVNTTGTSFNTIYSFTSSAGNTGNYPYAGLLYSGGMMYGMAQSGGANGYGTIFKFTPATTAVTPTVVHDFANATDGYNPRYTLSAGPDGKFYGTTYQGGVNSGGTAFRIDTSNNFTTLYSFDSTLSSNPYNSQDGVIVGSDNNLYLTTRNGIEFGTGTVDTIDISLHYAVNATTSVTVTLGTLTLSGGTYNGNLTVKNTGTATILGPVNVVLTNLTGGTTLVNKTGNVPSGYDTATGKPYIQAAPTGSAQSIFALAAGKSVTIPVKFSANTGTSANSQTWLRRF